MKRAVKYRFILLVLSALTVMFLDACQMNKGSHLALTGPAPNEERLRERIREFHRVLGDNDIASWYAMTSPTVTKKMTFEDFKKDFRWDENASRRTKSNMKGELARICSCEQMTYLRCVLVVDVQINEGGIQKRERPLEMWEFGDNEWYWGYIGHDSRGKCPGEK